MEDSGYTPSPDEIMRILGRIGFGEIDTKILSDEEYNQRKKAQANREEEKKEGKKKDRDEISEDSIKTRYAHIKELIVEFFYIDTRVPPYCAFCEVWKKNTLERKWFRKLNELLRLPESAVSVREIPCDHNCFHATKYFDESDRTWKEYPLDLDEWGINYCYAFGLGIEYFPSLRIRIRSNLPTRSRTLLGNIDLSSGKESPKGNKDLESRWREFVFPALGKRVKKEQIYHIGGKDFPIEKKVITLSILKPLLKFLRDLDISKAELPPDERFSYMMGQYKTVTGR